MVPNPLITPAPTIPAAARQPRQISSLLPAIYSSVPGNELSPWEIISSLVAQESAAIASYSVYSDDPYAELSSLMAQYSSALASYSIPYYSYSIPAYTSNAAAFTRTGGGAQATTAGAENTAAPKQTNGKSAGLSQGAKIGIGVGVTLGVLLLIGMSIFLWCAGKSRGKKKATTIVQAPVPQQQQAQYQPVPQMSGQGYMMGYSQHGPMQPNTTGQPYMAPGQQQYGTYAGTDGGYAKGPRPDVVELEQEYHFGRPGVVEIGNGREEAAAVGNKKKGNK